LKKNEVTRFVTYHRRSNINRDLLNLAYDKGVGGSGATLYVIRVGPASPDILTKPQLVIGYFDMKLNQELFAIVNQDDEIERDYCAVYVDEDREYLESRMSPGERIVKIKIVPIDNE
jgi:hypothetical protein